MTDPHVLPPRDDEPSSSLLVRVKAQDRRAWDRLVHLYTPVIWCWCQREGLQPADVQDVCQEVFKAVWRGVQGFRRDQPGDTFLGWLRTITRSKIADWRRRRQAEVPAVGGSEAVTLAHQVADPACSPDDSETGAAEESLIYERAAALIRSEFEEKTWLAFRAVVVEGQTATDVAQALGMSPNAVYLAKSRVLKRLREEFAGLIETGGRRPGPHREGRYGIPVDLRGSPELPVPG